MKKTYQNPTTTVVTIKTVKMIATSLAVGNAYQEGNVVLSRESDGDFWDDVE